MNLYLDDDLAGPKIAQFLLKHGQDVRLPSDVGLRGKQDAVHFRQAIREGRSVLTRNHGDFKFLHELIMEAQGHHPGVIVIRDDSPPKPKMRPSDIARALANLAAAGVPVADQYIILNLWQ